MPTRENEAIRDEMMETNEKVNVNQFFKISEEQFKIDGLDKYCSWDEIKLPQRATLHSAGYDFYSPVTIQLHPGTSIKIPTGIRVRLNPNNVLLCVPRSSLGFKFKMKLDNTVGVIDADYFYSDNEGHIWASITNMSSDKILCIEKGQAFMQGIIVNYGLTVDDNVTTIRNGGFGSTDKK